jgi:uncharacterized SAM-binding protein YcdF (DUF218 family)
MGIVGSAWPRANRRSTALDGGPAFVNPVDNTAPVALPVRRRRRVRRVALAFIAVGVVYAMFNLVQIIRVGRHDEPRSADAIVVMGAAQWNGRPSPALKGRLDRALELWNAGLAPLIVLTGGKQPSDVTTEAAVSAEYLRANGVPDEAMLLEVQGTSTWESLAAAHRFLVPRGATRIVVVSDAYHLLRVKLIGGEVGFDKVWTVASRHGTERFKPKNMVKEVVGVSIGRIIGFRRLTRWVGG